MLGDDVGEDAAAHEEFGGDAHEARLQFGDEVVEDAVGDGLVETALVTERPDVELEALQFDAFRFGNVIEQDGGEIRLAGFRAQAGEFRNFHVDVEITLRCGVGEGFEGLAGLGAHGRAETKKKGKVILYAHEHSRAVKAERSVFAHQKSYRAADRLRSHSCA